MGFFQRHRLFLIGVSAAVGIIAFVTLFAFWTLGAAPQETSDSARASAPSESSDGAKSPAPPANSGDSDAPFLPWPPLTPSARGEITAQIGLGKTFGDEDQRISKVLTRSGYSGQLYFSVPNGFALLTPLEHIGPNGEILSGPDRWTLAKETASWSWSDYVRKLFQGPDGRYRMFVFIVTSQPVNPIYSAATGQDVERWEHTGHDRLSDALSLQTMAPRTHVYLYVYEFHMDKGRMSASGNKLQALSENDQHNALPFGAHVKAMRF